MSGFGRLALTRIHPYTRAALIINHPLSIIDRNCSGGALLRADEAGGAAAGDLAGNEVHPPHCQGAVGTEVRTDGAADTLVRLDAKNNRRASVLRMQWPISLPSPWCCHVV